MPRLVSILVLTLALHHGAVTAAAVDQEDYWRQTLMKSHAEDIVWLKRDSEKTLALIAEDRTGNPQGAAIILHAAGAHPDWPEVVAPLRKALPDFGWITLSVQMPVLPRTAELSDYGPLFEDVPSRLDSAIAELQSRGIQNIVIIGHGLGSIMAASYLAERDNTPVKAFIGISMGDYQYIDKHFDTTHLLAQIAMPMLDIYGSRDNSAVVNTAQLRARAAQLAGLSATMNRQLNVYQKSANGRSAATRKAGYITYRRFEIAGADADFTGFEAILIKRIVGWLKQHAGGISLASQFN